MFDLLFWLNLKFIVKQNFMDDYDYTKIFEKIRIWEKIKKMFCFVQFLTFYESITVD